MNTCSRNIQRFHCGITISISGGCLGIQLHNALQTFISVLVGRHNCSEFVFTPMSPAKEVNKRFKEKQWQERGSDLIVMLHILLSSQVYLTHHFMPSLYSWAKCRSRITCTVHFKHLPTQNIQASKNTRKLNMFGFSFIFHHLKLLDFSSFLGKKI